MLRLRASPGNRCGSSTPYGRCRARDHAARPFEVGPVEHPSFERDHAGIAGSGERGHHAVGLDGAAPFVEMARSYSGCEVWQQDFLDLNLPSARFDGVFANATLFHVPSAALPGVLARLHACLRPRGVLFASNPRGDNREGWNGLRYGAYYDLEGWRAIVVAAGFEEILHYFRPPGLPREQQPWLASVWRARPLD